MFLLVEVFELILVDRRNSIDVKLDVVEGLGKLSRLLIDEKKRADELLEWNYTAHVDKDASIGTRFHQGMLPDRTPQLPGKSEKPMECRLHGNNDFFQRISKSFSRRSALEAYLQVVLASLIARGQVGTMGTFAVGEYLDVLKNSM